MRRPNLLIILADGMQAETISPDHACLTPNLEQLAHRGVRFDRAHTTCPTCSPARASLMTGLLPHNHGVLEVEHGRDDDQCVLREQYPHFAQRLSAAGYRTAYFGKWHIERSQEVAQFGWNEGIVKSDAHLKGIGRGSEGPRHFDLDEQLCGYIDGPDGYRRLLHWGVTDTPLMERFPGRTVSDAESFLYKQDHEEPWCCCVSFSEPNEALVVGRDAVSQYDPMTLPLPDNFFDDMTGRPNLYQREQRIGRRLAEEHWRWARACYFGRISEVDALVGRLMNGLKNVLEQTIVVFLADHGRYVGAHGFDAHNFGGFEEIYRIPLIVAGPEVAEGQVCQGQVGIADLCPTLCDLGQAKPIEASDSRSLVPLLGEPELAADFDTGYAEYHGTRFPLMQRIVWQRRWKFIFNGFDYDELYDLENDPYETTNLIDEPDLQPVVRNLMTAIWKRVQQTGDRTIAESHYFSMRFAVVGPDTGVP